MYDPINISWTDLSVAVSGTAPPPRDGHGFALVGGKLYVHGGYGTSGAFVGRDSTKIADRPFLSTQTLRATRGFR